MCFVAVIGSSAKGQKTGKISDSVYRICSNDGFKVYTSTTGTEGDAYYVFYTNVVGDSLFMTEENFNGKKLEASYGKMNYVRNIAIPFKDPKVTIGEPNNKWRGGDVYQIKIDFPSLGIKQETRDKKGKKTLESKESIILIINGKEKADAIKKKLGK